jgi:hypothetical protein
MSNSETYPYTIETQPCGKLAGHFWWTIRVHGKLLERSERAIAPIEEAKMRGMKALERMIAEARNPRGRR